YRISKATQRKVLQRAKQLNFRPNYFAKALNLRRTGVIGIVFPNVFEPFMSEVVKGIEDVLYPADYTMALSTSRFDRQLEQRILEQMCYRGVDGILLVFNAPFRGQAYDYSHLHALLRQDMPVVFIDRTLHGGRAPCVLQNDHDGAYQATDALIRAGCRHVAYVSLDIDVETIRARHAGYCAALAAHNRKPSPRHRILLDRRDPGASDLSTALDRLMASRTPPDGFFVTTNGLSYKLRYLLRRRGLTLNKDVRIAKFGADPDYHASGMYCVEQPHVAMGQAAARTVLALLDGDADAVPRRTVLESTLRECSDDMLTKEMQ
ncbi:MAG: substrate-binding domain-containing protein, partial [Chitinivibrionales bacterium]|nr:substrate-binding domain-containing protein [Chitinivibrionales bacterium]